MIHGFGLAVIVYFLAISHCNSKNITPTMKDEFFPYPAIIKKQDNFDFQNEDEQSPRLYFDSLKTILVRTVKSYRAVKPEFNVAMCFFRYAGIISSDGRSGKLLKLKDSDKDKEELTVKTLVRDIVHIFVLILSDFTPEPVSRVLRMTLTMWTMSKNMYKTVKQDEMGNCSLDYMSRRFWWWLGI